MKSLKDIAARQYGLVSRDQIINLGTSPRGIARALESGTVQLAAPSVYRLSGAPESWEQLVLAAVLWAGSGVASHRTAAALHKIDGFKELGIEISTRKQREFKTPTFKVHRTAVPERLVTTVRGIRVTKIHRTLSDLGTAMAPEPYGRAVEAAIRQGLTTLPALKKYLEAEKEDWNPGLSVLRGWIEAGTLEEGPSASPFQRRVRDLLQPIGGFREEVRILDPAGRELARVDFGHETRPVIVEADSARHHSGRDDWYHDLARRNKVTAQGYQVLHVTPRDLRTAEQRAAFQDLVRATLASSAPREGAAKSGRAGGAGPMLAVRPHAKASGGQEGS